VSATDHEHTFVWDCQELLPCACGANMMAIESVLSAAAGDARRAVGDAYYTGCRLRQELEKLELWLFNAPSHVLQELQVMHPGIYLIHNDAPRPRTAVDALRDSFDLAAWKAEGINANVVGPTEDGYLQVGVLEDVEAAQKKLDALYGSHVVEVYESRPIHLLSASPGR
jgi:hypothetical protein